MRRYLLLLLCCSPTLEVLAQSTILPPLDNNALELGRRVALPLIGLFLLGYFVLAAINLVLNYLLKNKIIEAGTSAATSESIIKRLLPGPQEERNQVVKRIALLFSTGAGLLLCNWYLPVGIHSLIILIFSTALGFSAYYFFLRRQAN